MPPLWILTGIMAQMTEKPHSNTLWKRQRNGKRKGKRCGPVNYNNKSSRDVAVGLSFYQDKECLRHCLLSLRLETHPFFKVIAIDGPYKGFKSKSPKKSTDGSREIIRVFKSYSPNSVYLYDYPNLNERCKRQKYVDIAGRKNIDWLLILDSDEYLSTFNAKLFFKALKWIEQENEDNNEEEGSTYGILMYDVEQHYSGFRPRLWYRPKKISYNETHYQFTARKVRNIQPDAIQITHCHQVCRPQKRHEQQLDYEYRLPTLEA
jgi:hypothetical protein